MIGFDEASALVASVAAPLGVERLTLSEAAGRILARPVIAAVTAPPCDMSAMDGYALREADLAALPATLEVVGESFPARPYDRPLPPGGCVRIFTGAPVPAGADRVVIQEMVERRDRIAAFAAPPGAARHIRKAGSDFREGDQLLAPGRRLDFRALVAAAAADLAEVDCYRRPKLVILGTGDELVAPGSARSQPPAIPESLTFGLHAFASAWGGEMLGSRRLPDDLALLERAAAEALEQADLVLVTGGASVGEKDFAKRMFAPCGLELLFSKVAIKPGKPVWLGRACGRLVMGLPGNPTSALVTARLLLAPLLAGLTGLAASSALAWREAVLGAPLAPCGDRETFDRGRETGGKVFALSNQDSGAQKALVEADLLIRRRAGAPACPAGAPVEVLSF